MFQSLLAEIKEYKKPSFLASFYMFLEVIFEISIPFVMALLLDKGVQMGDMQQVALYGGLMLVCAFLSLFCGMQSARYGLLLQLVLPRTCVRPSSPRFSPSPSRISTASLQGG